MLKPVSNVPKCNFKVIYPNVEKDYQNAQICIKGSLYIPVGIHRYAQIYPLTFFYQSLEGAFKNEQKTVGFWCANEPLNVFLKVEIRQKQEN